MREKNVDYNLPVLPFYYCNRDLKQCPQNTIVCLHCFNSCLCPSGALNYSLTPGCSMCDKGVASYICQLMFVYTMAAFSIHLQRTITSKQSFNADGNPKITSKGHCCNLDLAPCILQKVRDIRKRTLVGHLFSELFFELSHMSLITFCSNKHVFASVFSSFRVINTSQIILSNVTSVDTKDESDSDNPSQFLTFIDRRLLHNGHVQHTYHTRIFELFLLNFEYYIALYFTVVVQGSNFFCLVNNMSSCYKQRN